MAIALKRGGALPLIRSAALPVAILLLVVLMVVPIPSAMLDLFFIMNITISLAVLMVALNAQKPLDFSAFPTVLLFATLFRLSLNVASTRVVLVHGHEGESAAGHVIEAFGTFLIGGDYVVGLFVFAILVIINMIVVTKGAGRVSEVSARFTLDALPGKQMAIDADLNAGLITPDEAKARRIEVATEADFYGSMDGSSKFVKGDAVAGLLILAANIIGGLILGPVSHGMTIGAAAHNYVLLAIGDALVAQIPSLMLSIAAAAIVTRVTSSLDLAGQIGSQFGSAKTWTPVAVILALLGVMPGMPHIVILPAAAAAGFAAWRLRQAANRPPPVEPVAVEPVDQSKIGWDEVTDTMQVNLDIGYGLVPLVDERRGSPLMGRITGVRRQLSKELGFVVPQVRVRDDINLPPFAYRIVVGGVVVGEDSVSPDEMLALDTGQAVGQLRGKPAKDPTFGLDAVWIAPGDTDAATGAGYLVVPARPACRRTAWPGRGAEPARRTEGSRRQPSRRALAATLAADHAHPGVARPARGECAVEGIPPHRCRDRRRRAEVARCRRDHRDDPSRPRRPDHLEAVRRARAAARDDARGPARRAARPGRSVRPVAPSHHRTRPRPPHRRRAAARRPAARRRGQALRPCRPARDPRRDQKAGTNLPAGYPRDELLRST